MAYTYDTVPNNFASGADKSVTRYLDLAGLSTFWGKVKDYTDEADKQIFDKLNKQSDDYNAALRAYIESLTINGLTVITDKDDAQNNGVGFNLELELGGEDIKVRRVGDTATTAVDWDVTKSEADNKDARHYTYSDGNWKVDDAIENMDARLDCIQNELAEGVVSGFNVTVQHGEYFSGTADDTSDDVQNKEWVKVTGNAVATNKQVGDLTLDIDDTAINDKFNSLDEEIDFLVANAGVTNIQVTDVDSASTTNKGLVELSLRGTKLADGTETNEGDFEEEGITDALRRGNIDLILDESVLDETLDAIDATVAAEIADRKEDVANLAGSGYTPADRDTEGAWDADVKYKDITVLSERLAEIDENLVAKIVDGNDPVEGGHGDLNAQNEKYVTFTVEESATGKGANDKNIVLTLNDNNLQDYIETLNDELATLDKFTINGHTAVTVEKKDDNGYVTVDITKTDVTLTTSDIDRPSADGQSGANLEDTLLGYDAKIMALASATHFRGAYVDKATACANIKDQGDVVIIGNKEYVYYDPNVTDDDYQPNGDFSASYVVKEEYLVELGDTEQETQRIAALETWVNTNIISVTDMENSTYFDWTVPTYTA
jgi:hypothetical protein